MRETSKKIFKRSDFGLSEDGFVYCCFNNNFKITPQLFDSWSTILQNVDNSILWLLGDVSEQQENLKKEIEARGIDKSRLIFANRMSNPEYLARYKFADLFLDTFPFNAGTTANDALWAGLPLLTLSGEAFASRMAGSLLMALEIPELIAKSVEEYESIAIQLAKSCEKLQVIKNKITKNRFTANLFDTTSFTKHLEAAYVQIYERCHADFLPDHIYIEK